MSCPADTGRIRLLLLASLPLLAVACAGSARGADQAQARWQGTSVREGSTLRVRTTGGSLWSGKGTLVEEAAIGTETRGENDLLGEVSGLDATSDRIFILDRTNYTVRVYDMDGRHIRNIGRRGQGPGELRSPADLGIDPVRGHLIVREGGQGVLTRFTLSGRFVGTSRPVMQGGLSGYRLLLRVTREGVTIVPNFTYRMTPGTSLGYVQTFVLYTIDSTGAKADSLLLPEYQHEQFQVTATVNREGYRPEPVPFGPQEVWSIGWDGALITGYAGEYRFEIRYRDGRRTVIERDAERVRVLPEERDWATRKVYGIMRGFRRGWTWNGPRIPDAKPWYSDITPDRSGRLWVLREGEGRRVPGWTAPAAGDWRGWEQNPAWVPEKWFEVFEEATGRYMGRVDAPQGFLAERGPIIEGNTFICLTEDDEGRPIVRRYRLVLPS